VFSKIRSYSLEAVTAIVFLSLLYTAARSEVLDVMNVSLRNSIVAAPSAR
jgi:hypothetical protein